MFKIPPVLLVLFLALVAGCERRSPAEQAAALGAELATIQGTFPVDPTAEQARELTKSAERAGRLYRDLQKLQAEHPADPAVAATRAAAEPRFAAIRRSSRVAEERRELARLLGGMKVRGYRAARRAVIPKLIDTLASAARQAAETDFGTLPAIVRQAAGLAAVLAEVAPPAATAEGGATSAPLGRTEWLLAAQRLETFNRHEPGEFALGLAITYGALGKCDLALVELERAEGAVFDRPELAPLVPLARALVLSRLGFTELAAGESSRVSGSNTQGRQLLAAIHAVLAYAYGAEKDWVQMDRELGEAVRIWPNNPLVVYLSGERLLADGRREQALETFARASGAEAAWFAPLLEARVRAVRDSTGEVPPLLPDKAFLFKAVLYSLVEEARGTMLGEPLTRLAASVRLLPALLGSEPAGEDAPVSP
ncbi:MAG: hypothetical protein QM691_06310 [Opitutaceae bacterium]